jgi:hypothetical protein
VIYITFLDISQTEKEVIYSKSIKFYILVVWEEREGVAPVQRKCAGEESPISEGARIPLRLMKPERGRESAGKCHRKHTALCVFTHKVRVKRCGKSAPRKGEGLREKTPLPNPFLR